MIEIELNNIDRIIKNATYTMTYSNYVKDYDCNYAIDVNSNANFDEIEKEMQKVNRIPCYIVTPLSNIYKARNAIFDKNKFSCKQQMVFIQLIYIEKLDLKMYVMYIIM